MSPPTKLPKKGKSFLSTGYVYAPYVPLFSSPAISTMTNNTRVNDKKSLPNYNLTIQVYKETTTGGIRTGFDSFNVHLGQVLECYITEPANVSLGIIPLVTGNKFLVTSIWEYDLSRFASEVEKEERLRIKLVSLEGNTWGEGVVSFALNFRQREPVPTNLEPGQGTAGGHICVVSGKNLREFIEKGNLAPYLNGECLPPILPPLRV